MTRFTLSILEEHRAALKRSLLRDGREYAALLLCGRSQQINPWTGELEERFLVRELIEVEESAFQQRTPTKLTWSTTPFYRALKQVEGKGFAVAVVHSHPTGPLRFSPADDIADQEICQIAFNRLESDRPHLTIVMDGQGQLIARAFGPDLKPKPVELIRIIGHRWHFSHSVKSYTGVPDELERQARAFGSAAVAQCMALKVGIAGCGGTGSAVAALLARVGIRHLALFDADRVEQTNLNRLHFSTRTDANLRRRKVDVIGEAVAAIGLPISVTRFALSLDDPQCRDALRSCDVIFGCTDDHLGRNYLNRLAHFYLIPVIDLGLLIEPNQAGGYDSFDGRVTVVQPGYPCQLCRGLVQPTLMLAEHLRRHDPILHGERLRAGYIPDATDPSPVVVTFTTELASMAVNELLQRIVGFRGDAGYCSERVRKFNEVKDADTVPAGKAKPDCPLCGRRKYDARGDMTPFLDIAE